MGGWKYTNEALPDDGATVEIWYYTACMLAYHTGGGWTAVAEWRGGALIPIAPTLLPEPVLNWREYR